MKRNFEIETAIRELERLVSKFAPGLKTKSVVLTEDSDFDGSQIVRVRIVHFGRKADVKTFSKQRFQISDGFRAWLLARGDDRFPHFTYRSEADDKLEKDSRKLDPTP
jgi:hypothetical protein